MYHSPDTIAAIATAPGPGGIAVLRMSGPGALAVLLRVFRPLAPGGGEGERTFQPRPRYMHYGHVLDAQGRMLDDVLAVYMPGPHSATGEDVAEVHCHGGPGIVAALLASVFAAGARPAEPGEFTRRAFLHGRMDLTQAEAVAELIAAPTREGVRLAAAKREGGLSRQVKAVRETLDALRAQVLLAIDFPDEDAEFLSAAAFAHKVRDCSAALERLLAGFERARLWREGAVAVLAGRVNAGKSSLLNALLGRERAIVSPEPGTTRDYIEESINLDGLPVRLVDTAGLRQGGDVVEEEGIRRSEARAREADVVLFVADVRAPLQREERDFLCRRWPDLLQGRLVLVLNKIDCLCPQGGNASLSQDGCGSAPEGAFDEAAAAEGAGRAARAMLAAAAPQGTGEEALDRLVAQGPVFAVSATRRLGLEALSRGLRAAVCGAALPGDGPSSGDLAPNLRQSQLLREAGEELALLLRATEEGLAPEALGVHLDAAAALLDQVTGSSSTEELLDSIFASFCIGK